LQKQDVDLRLLTARYSQLESRLRATQSDLDTALEKERAALSYTKQLEAQVQQMRSGTAEPRMLAGPPPPPVLLPPPVASAMLASPSRSLSASTPPPVPPVLLEPGRPQVDVVSRATSPVSDFDLNAQLVYVFLLISGD
jgi:hypothetical protein